MKPVRPRRCMACAGGALLSCTLLFVAMVGVPVTPTPMGPAVVAAFLTAGVFSVLAGTETVVSRLVGWRQLAGTALVIAAVGFGAATHALVVTAGVDTVFTAVVGCTVAILGVLGTDLLVYDGRHVRPQPVQTPAR